MLLVEKSLVLKLQFVKQKLALSFAARFSGVKGSLKDKKGRPTRLALALKKWGFRNKDSARKFAQRHKKKT